MKDSRAVFTVFLRIIKLFFLVLVIIAVGVAGYILIEGWNFLDAFYMSIISLTTVGYEIPHQLTQQGKIFTCIYLLFSVVLFLYLVSEFARYLINVNLEDLFTRRKMNNKIKNLKDHYVVCGYGLTGKEIVSQLVHEKLPFVIIEKDTEALEKANELKYLTVHGDATDDDILLNAQIEQAKGLFAVLSDDAANLFVTLSARNLSPQAVIVVRCLKPHNEEKFMKAGADNIVSPLKMCGLRMVSSVVRPLVAGFLSEAVETRFGYQLRIEQFQLHQESPICGKSIQSAEIRLKTGTYILTVHRDNAFIHNPAPDFVLQALDYIIVIGSTEQLLRFEGLICQRGEALA